MTHQADKQNDLDTTENLSDKATSVVEQEQAHPIEAAAVQHPASYHSETSSTEVSSRRERYGYVRQMLQLYRSNKRVSIPLTTLAIIILIAAVPFSRYALLGLFVQEQLSVTVVDSQTNTPISNVSLKLDSRSAVTNASGIARIQSTVGYHTLAITKQYYRVYNQSQLIDVSERHNQITIKLVALGRLVPVTVIDKVSGKPVKGATIGVIDTSAITGTNGVATIVLPPTATTQKITIDASGYNGLSGTMTVTDQIVSANSYALVPTGKIYFLSNLSGKIDVVKTDLDGSNRQTVVAGTGSENQYSTALLASRDWKYLALYTQRKATGNPEISLIDTSTDTLSNIDEGDASFNLVGWSGDNFVYQVSRGNLSVWQSGHQALKSFNATTKKLTQLAQTTGSGSNSYDYAVQQFGGIYITHDQVVYVLNWQAGSQCYYGATLLAGKQATLNTVNIDGSSPKTVKGFSPSEDKNECSLGLSSSSYDKPDSLALAFAPNGSDSQYYEYANGAVTPAEDISSGTFNSSGYPTFLLSPSGSKAFWSKYADGKNNLTVADQDAQNPKTIVSESDYSPYGWFTDNYLIVSKNSSELYILSPDSAGQPVKITNYYKPQLSYRGYGGGYGGI